MLCANCDDTSKLIIGQTYQLRCSRCCSHNKGTWTVTESFAGYREGFKTEVCSNGCGTILKEEQLLG
jgi:hypothetical protein